MVAIGSLTLDPVGLAIVLFDIFFYVMLQIKADGIGPIYGGAITGWTSLLLVTWAFVWKGLLTVEIIAGLTISLIAVAGVITAFAAALGSGPDGRIFWILNRTGAIVGHAMAIGLTLFG